MVGGEKHFTILETLKRMLLHPILTQNKVLWPLPSLLLLWQLCTILLSMFLSKYLCCLYSFFNTAFICNDRITNDSACVNLSLSFEVVLFHETTWTKHKKVFIFGFYLIWWYKEMLTQLMMLLLWNNMK